jgi:hypothetical protein
VEKPCGNSALDEKEIPLRTAGILCSTVEQERKSTPEQAMYQPLSAFKINS